MPEIRRRRFLLLLALALSACTPSVDTAAEAEKLLQLDQEFAEAAYAEGAAAAFRRYLAPDAVELPDSQLPLVGRDAIYTAMLEDSELDLTWTAANAAVARSGDLGYTWGTFWLSWQDEEGNPVASEGKYLMIWRKNPGGRWRVVVDISNENP